MKCRTKQYFALFFVMIMLAALSGCKEEKTHMDFPVAAEEVVSAEMFHHGILRGEPVSLEKKTVTTAEDIQSLMSSLENAELEPAVKEIEEYTDVYAFRFYSSGDEEPFEITYFEYGVKKGILKLKGDDTAYFTIANIGWLWGQLNEELIAVHADVGELPK